jgi:hypothetical protein
MNQRRQAPFCPSKCPSVPPPQTARVWLLPDKERAEVLPLLDLNATLARLPGAGRASSRR